MTDDAELLALWLSELGGPDQPPDATAFTLEAIADDRGYDLITAAAVLLGADTIPAARRKRRPEDDIPPGPGRFGQRGRPGPRGRPGQPGQKGEKGFEELHPRDAVGQFLKKDGEVKVEDNTVIHYEDGSDLDVSNKRGRIKDITRDPETPGRPDVTVEILDPQGNVVSTVTLKPKQMSASQAKARIGEDGGDRFANAPTPAPVDRPEEEDKGGGGGGGGSSAKKTTGGTEAGGLTDQQKAAQARRIDRREARQERRVDWREERQARASERREEQRDIRSERRAEQRDIRSERREARREGDSGAGPAPTAPATPAREAPRPGQEAPGGGPGAPSELMLTLARNLGWNPRTEDYQDWRQERRAEVEAAAQERGWNGRQPIAEFLRDERHARARANGWNPRTESYTEFRESQARQAGWRPGQETIEEFRLRNRIEHAGGEPLGQRASQALGQGWNPRTETLPEYRARRARDERAMARQPDQARPIPPPSRTPIRRRPGESWEDFKKRRDAAQERVPVNAAGLQALGFKHVSSSFTEALHPRGHDGQFIKKFGFVKLITGHRAGSQGRVEDITADPNEKGESIVRVNLGDDIIDVHPKDVEQSNTKAYINKTPEGGYRYFKNPILNKLAGLGEPGGTTPPATPEPTPKKGDKVTFTGLLTGTTHSGTITKVGDRGDELDPSRITVRLDDGTETKVFPQDVLTVNGQSTLTEKRREFAGQQEDIFGREAGPEPISKPAPAPPKAVPQAKFGPKYQGRATDLTPAEGGRGRGEGPEFPRRPAAIAFAEQAPPEEWESRRRGLARQEAFMLPPPEIPQTEAQRLAIEPLSDPELDALAEQYARGEPVDETVLNPLDWSEIQNRAMLIMEQHPERYAEEMQAPPAVDPQLVALNEAFERLANAPGDPDQVATDLETFWNELTDEERAYISTQPRRPRVAAIVAALTAASFEVLHPRGHDGKFIEKGGIIRFFSGPNKEKRGTVTDIQSGAGDSEPTIVVQMDDGSTVNATPDDIEQAPEKARIGETPDIAEATRRMVEEGRTPQDIADMKATQEWVDRGGGRSADWYNEGPAEMQAPPGGSQEAQEVWKAVLAAEAAQHGRARAPAEKKARRLLAEHFDDYEENAHKSLEWWANRMEGVIYPEGGEGPAEMQAPPDIPPSVSVDFQPPVTPEPSKKERKQQIERGLHQAGVEAELQAGFEKYGWQWNPEPNTLTPGETAAAAAKVQAGEPIPPPPHQPADLFDMLSFFATSPSPVDLTLIDHFSSMRESGIPRSKMPQIPVDQLEAFQDRLRAAGVTFGPQEVDPNSLQATQAELDGKNVGGMIGAVQAGDLDLTSNPLWISSDDHVLDGHHRWAAAAAISAKCGGCVQLPVIRVNMSMDDLLAFANAFNDEAGVQRRGFGETSPQQPTAAETPVAVVPAAPAAVPAAGYTTDLKKRKKKKPMYAAGEDDQGTYYTMATDEADGITDADLAGLPKDVIPTGSAFPKFAEGQKALQASLRARVHPVSETPPDSASRLRNP